MRYACAMHSVTLQAVRTDRILSLLQDQTACFIAALAQDLSVSEGPVRRDVRGRPRQ